MKKTLTTCTALAAVLASLASPAFAAPRHAPVANDTVAPYGQGTFEQLARPSDVVTTQGRVVGADPDANIRTQLLHDPVPSEY